MSELSRARSLRRALLCPALAVALALAGAARADDAPTLESATQAYEGLLYDEAARQLRAILARPESAEAERLEAHRLLGTVEVIRGNNEEARRQFAEVLRRDPDATLPDHLSPKITRFFEWVRADLRRAESEPAAPAPAPTTTLAAASATTPAATAPAVAASAPPAEAGRCEPTPAAPGAAAPAAASPALEEEAGMTPLWMIGAAGAGLAVGALVGVVVTALAFAPPGDDGRTVMQLP